MRSAVLVVLMAGAALGQMTFSDGWEKRQPSRHMVPQKMIRSGGVQIPHATEDEGAQTAKILTMDSCNIDYSQGLMELHREMMELYARFKSCQAKAPVFPPPSAKEEPAF